MNELVMFIPTAVSILVLGLFIAYQIRSSSREVREQSMVIKQQTDRLIVEGNKRLEAGMAESHKILKEIGLTNRQIFD